MAFHLFFCSCRRCCNGNHLTLIPAPDFSLPLFFPLRGHPLFPDLITTTFPTQIESAYRSWTLIFVFPFPRWVPRAPRLYVGDTYCVGHPSASSSERARRSPASHTYRSKSLLHLVSSAYLPRPSLLLRNLDQRQSPDIALAVPTPTFPVDPQRSPRSDFLLHHAASDDALGFQFDRAELQTTFFQPHLLIIPPHLQPPPRSPRRPFPWGAPRQTTFPRRSPSLPRGTPFGLAHPEQKTARRHRPVVDAATDRVPRTRNFRSGFLPVHTLPASRPILDRDTHRVVKRNWAVRIG